MTVVPHYVDPAVTLYAGDCVEVMAGMADRSVDAVVTDPPYALPGGFMGKDWDRFSPLAFQAWCQLWAAECLRVLKPGGHLLAFGGTRTHHRLACAVEDAGFEIRDSITWLYGSGFPKSLDVSKAIDRAAGAERECTGRVLSVTGNRATPSSAMVTSGLGAVGVGPQPHVETAPATDAARQWQGWGTALKPSSEMIVVARKPLSGNVAANVQQWGTGALNIDGCRVDTAGETWGGNRENAHGDYSGKVFAEQYAKPSHPAGRWPPNVVLDGDAAAELDRQSGNRPGMPVAPRRLGESPKGYGMGVRPDPDAVGYGDSGGASRFFPVFRYEAKAPQAERPSYVSEGAGEGRVIGRTVNVCRVCGNKTIRSGAGASPACGHDDYERVPIATRSDRIAHPTTKPLDLMRWLVRLVTPPGGTVLDCFAGSGTTGEAAVVEGFRCVLIEKEPTYLPLIVARLSKPIQPDMFGASDDLWES